MSKLQLSLDGIIYNELIDCYVKHGDIEKANSLCTEMFNNGILLDKTAYHSLIAGCLEGATDLFNNRIGKGLAPSDNTFNMLIQGHCKMNDIEGAFMWYKEMLKMGLHPSVSACNILLSGLKQEGRLEEAEIVCSGMSMKDVDEQGLCKNLSSTPAV